METIFNKIDITSFCDSTSKVNKTFGVSLKKEKNILEMSISTRSKRLQPVRKSVTG